MNFSFSEDQTLLRNSVRAALDEQVIERTCAECQREHRPGRRDVDHLGVGARREVALDPVIRRADAVAVQRFPVACFLAVELGALPQHLVDAVDLGAVRIFRGLDPRMVLAVLIVIGLSAAAYLFMQLGGIASDPGEDGYGRAVQSEILERRGRLR